MGVDTGALYNLAEESEMQLLELTLSFSSVFILSPFYDPSPLAHKPARTLACVCVCVYTCALPFQVDVKAFCCKHCQVCRHC